MNEPASRQSIGYWMAVVVLLLAGAWVVASPADQGFTSPGETTRPPNSLSPTHEDLTSRFRTFRDEVAQLTPVQQDQVWQSMRDRTESLAEETLYEFFSLPASTQREIVDRTIDRIEWRRQWFQQLPERPQPGERPPDRPFHGFGGPPTVRSVADDGSQQRPIREMDLDERLALRRDMWEDATPQAHAMRAEFLRLLGERRKERGIPESMFRRA